LFKYHWEKFKNDYAAVPNNEVYAEKRCDKKIKIVVDKGKYICYYNQAACEKRVC